MMAHKAYRLVNVAFVSEVKPCKLHREPNQHDDQGYNGKNVRIHDPNFIDLGCEDNHEIENVVEEVVVKQHLKVQGR